MSSQDVWAWVTGGPGALLVSPFNVKWRFSVQAGGVEGSKFCLFSVPLPARCVSSISPRFHCRRCTFYFLPLATILESFATFVIPKSIMTDNDPTYTSKKIQEFCKLWDITYNTGIPYNPQGQAIKNDNIKSSKTNFLK
jgi:transposase InsO family protein